MVFAGPPEDDVDWADVSPAGSRKFLSRAWRLAGDVTSPVGVDVTTGDTALRRVTHRAVADAGQAIEEFRFNVAVAKVMELVNATRKAIDSGPGAGGPGGAGGGRGGGGDAVARRAVHGGGDVGPARPRARRSPVPAGPPSTRRCWSRTPSPASSRWPGKVRARLEVSPSIGEDELRALALADESVVRAVDGREVRTVVVRAPKLVNVVPA